MRNKQRKPDMRNIVRDYMNEKISLGGLVLPRLQALELLQADGCSRRAIDWSVYAKDALPPETPLTPKSIVEEFTAYLRGD